MGFIEETGAAQHYRDARITPIYEGTTGIQAADLIGRKIAREDGKTIGLVIAEMIAVRDQLAQQSDAELQAIGKALATSIEALQAAVQFIVSTFGPDVRQALVGSVPFLELFGIVAGGWQMARAALVSQQRLAEGQGDASFLRGKILTTRFYADHVLSAAPGLSLTVTQGASSALALQDDQF